MHNQNALLEVDGLTISHHKEGVTFSVVSEVSFTIKKGETVSLVGESGCGKTSIAKAILGIATISSGKITYRKKKKFDRKHIQMIFQDPYSSLNPRMTIEEIIEEPLIVYKLGGKAKRKARVEELFGKVKLPLSYRSRYPHELSGGERQRVSIARALSCKPELLICDEPTHALDVSVQASIINLLKDLRDSYNLSILFISHDLCLVKNISDRCLVMYRGKIVEAASVVELFSKPQHPFTKRLLASIPHFEKEAPLYINTEPKREVYKEPITMKSPILHSYVNNLQKSISLFTKKNLSANTTQGKCPYLGKCKDRTYICETTPVGKLSNKSDHQTLCHLAGKNK
ncbi:MAG: Vitamin B12 import ATP-binding protein BtuD [Chlamydiia bacterium]|nr:Vitamin B12 import ATP-binding protein BtuD [Chlamydiia bacterium]MCH9618920.1 Vitamin B12 import ATP-binding protein BtuD [Chlamydiia bacterium]MCH9624633.1 Vitamin B12 import ATP-binding protein BtuD [Chlamydiia bacterium]